MLARFLTLCLLTILLSLSSHSVAHAQYQENESAGSSETDNAAHLQVKITELEEQQRKVLGTIEQLNFQLSQIKTQNEKSIADITFRLAEIEKKQAATPAQVAPVASTPAPTPASSPDAIAAAVDHPKIDAVKTASDAPTAQESTAPKEVKTFASAKEHYSYALKLLNQAKYDEASDSFIAFTQAYSKDPLISNAYYWLGETYYVRKDYLKAADNFRMGYEALPTGSKAPDNLLKLAMALNALKKDKEACVVLKRVVSKYDSAASGTAHARAEQEINRIGCN